MKTRPAIVHLVLAFVLASLVWAPAIVCATQDERAVCSCATMAAPDAGTPIVTVDKSATPDSRSAGPALAAPAASGAVPCLPPPAPFATGREAGAAPGAAPRRP
jgi:hypothetical protein